MSATGLSLRCGDCGVLLKSVEEAQEHAELTSHSNFSESTEAVLNLVCTVCRKPCRSKTETDLHTKRTGHSDFSDLTSETAKPISLDPPISTDDDTQQHQEMMIVPVVDSNLIQELESMGFTTARATRALHYSGNTSLEAAINWIMEHENDSDIDQMPLVPASAKAEPPKPSLTEEEKRIKAQELRERARKKKEEEEKRMEREREKERIRVGKELLEAKRIEEDNERKRILALRKAEKDEERRAREKIRQKLEEDKKEGGNLDCNLLILRFRNLPHQLCQKRRAFSLLDPPQRQSGCGTVCDLSSTITRMKMPKLRGHSRLS
ncbi:hypothetical protein AQUCO_10800039v1 [Aquilegia coerulea]|uniref:UBA domain-containing protein n=1 Tax=Aquilegia coerulea TaxID=218851 RepID=A0A2G5C3B7_AQUCA|nr:hypothetical protein AQUCO_10800039v1 [Aquilegia coerulea]